MEHKISNSKTGIFKICRKTRSLEQAKRHPPSRDCKQNSGRNEKARLAQSGGLAPGRTILLDYKVTLKKGGVELSDKI